MRTRSDFIDEKVSSGHLKQFESEAPTPFQTIHDLPRKGGRSLGLSRRYRSRHHGGSKNPLFMFIFSQRIGATLSIRSANYQDREFPFKRHKRLHDPSHARLTGFR